MNTFLFIVLVALNIADAILTAKILARGGIEMNPAFRLVVDRLRPRTWIALKTFVAVVAGAVLAASGSPIATFLLMLFVGLYIFLVLHNYDEWKNPW